MRRYGDRFLFVLLFELRKGCCQTSACGIFAVFDGLQSFLFILSIILEYFFYCIITVSLKSCLSSNKLKSRVQKTGFFAKIIVIANETVEEVLNFR